jgi:hypothetical protein
VAGLYDVQKKATTTDAIKYPIQDDESYSIPITSSRNVAGDTGYKLTGESHDRG